MRIEKKDLFKLIAVLIIAIILIFIALNRKNTHADAKNKIPEGCTLVTSIPGVSFAVHTPLIDKATAISQMAENMDYSRSDLYVYKNGEDRYFMFSLDQMVIAAEKGTEFHFNEAGEEALNNSSVDGIWFSADQKKLDYDASEERSEATVTGGVVITNELYNDFAGKLVTVTDGVTEYSLFVGFPGTKYKQLKKNQKEVISTIIDSFGLYDAPVRNNEEIYSVVISGNILNDTEEITVSENEEEIQEITLSEDSARPGEIAAVSDNEPAVSENTVSEDTIEEIQEQESPKKEPADEIEEVEKTEEAEDTTVEVVSESAENDEVSENNAEIQEIQTVSEDTTEPKITVPGTTSKAETKPEDNTVNKKREDTTAYTSTKYAMLDVSKTGLFEIYDPASKTSTVEQAAVAISHIYGKDSAQKLYDEYRPTIGQKPELAPGCHWEAVEYTLKYSGTNKPYTDVKFAGLDGENLKFKGIKYTMRTFDLNSGTDENNTVRGKITLYAVPNGCLDYALKFGGDTKENIRTAYFNISRAGK